jgi:hypothetical protein
MPPREDTVDWNEWLESSNSDILIDDSPDTCVTTEVSPAPPPARTDKADDELKPSDELIALLLQAFPTHPWQLPVQSDQQPPPQQMPPQSLQKTVPYFPPRFNPNAGSAVEGVQPPAVPLPASSESGTACAVEGYCYNDRNDRTRLSDSSASTLKAAAHKGKRKAPSPYLAQTDTGRETMSGE